MKKVLAFFLLSLNLGSNLFGQLFFEKNTKYVVKGLGAPREESDYYSIQELYSDSIKSGIEYYHNLVWVGEKNTKQLYKVYNKKVYVISKLFLYRKSEYHLIYDFNLTVGDSILTDTIDRINAMAYNYYISKVDSIKQIYVGGKIKKTHYVTVKSKLGKHSYTFIENIGSLETGLIYFDEGGLFAGQNWQCLRICINDSAYVPKLKNNILEFISTPCMDSAYQRMVDVKNPNQSEILIFPNPVKDQLNIKNFKGEIELYNLTGSLLLTEKVTKEINLDIQFLPKGIYYLKLKDNGNSQIKKVLKL